MTILGLITAVAVLVVWVARREWTQYVVGATVAFPHTAALSVGIDGFPLFYFAVILVSLLSIPYLLMWIARPRDVPAVTPRRSLLPDVIGIVLAVWGLAISLVGPRAFTGMAVFNPAYGIDAQVGNMDSLTPSGDNLAQIGYLGFGVVFLLLSGRLFPVNSGLLSCAFWLSVIAAAIRAVAEPVWPIELLQNMNIYYATPERLSGTFAEPSYLGMYLTAAGAFMAVTALQARGLRRVIHLAGLVVVAVELLLNQSGTALVALAVVVFLAVMLWALRLITTARVRVKPGAVAAFAIGTAAALAQLGFLTALTVTNAAAKTETSSWVNRGASNLRAAEIFVESLGLGIGLGSNRPSSLFFLVLSCLGVVGVALLTALVVIALRAGTRMPAVTASAWALAGTVVAAVVAVPDLASPLFWTALAACLTPIVTGPPRQRRLNPVVNPHADDRATPPVRVSEPVASGSRGPSVGGTRKIHPTSPAHVPHGAPTPRRPAAVALVTPKDAA